MDTFKIVLFYRLHEQGWTETYYGEAQDAQSATDLTPARQDQLLAVHSQGTVLQACRASDVLNPRKTHLRIFEQSAQTNLNFTPDVTATCAYCDVQAGLTFNRPLYVRGLPDDAVVRGAATGVSQPSTTFTQQLARKKTAILSQGWRIRALIPSPPALWHGITSFEGANPQNSQTKVNTTLPAGVNVGTKIIFRGIDRAQMPGLKGEFSVVATTPTSLTIPIPYRNPAMVYHPVKAQFRTAAYQYAPITDVVFVRFSHRQTGRPIVPHRGRSAGVNYRR